MGLNRAMDISLSAIHAENTVMELIASNLANIDTTRTVRGGPYRARIVVLGEKKLTFAEALSRAQNKLDSGGVEVVEVIEDLTPFPKVYDPGHPDSDAQGYRLLSNVNLAQENIKQMMASTVYRANITAANASKKMMQDTLGLQ